MLYLPGTLMKLPSLKIKVRKLGKSGWLRVLLLVLAVGATGVLGAMFGAYMTIRNNLPSVDEIENLRPKIITTILSDKGEAVKEFAEERRIEVPYASIPDVLKKAIIATEDPRFYAHKGVDYVGILRAVKEDVIKIGRGSLRRPQGGSTITQQLARSLFLYSKQTIRRKLKEMAVALSIEKKYSKERILELYCNQFYLGHGAYGVESASNLYFGKSVSDLSLEEAALIAGIFRGPSVYSPYTNTEKTLQRRNHVLNRMAEEGYITKGRAEAAKATPIRVLPLRRTSAEVGAYFFEEVRRYLEKNYGADALYNAGLKVYTTLDPEVQKYAEDSLRAGLRVQDKKRGWRRDKTNLLAEGTADLGTVWLESWTTHAVEAGDVADAVVLTASKSEASVRLKDRVGRMTSKGIEWTQARNLDALIRPGDVIQVGVKTVPPGDGELTVTLDQEPQVEGAFLVIDPPTGQIKAMSGGYSYLRSQFNRATQALRQTGSVIKPFLYTAAVENGFSPATIIQDEPVTFNDKWTGEPWTPRNYDRTYKGSVTLRKGLEESRNVVTARILDYISPQVGVDYCRRFGLTSSIYPYLSLALGTFEVTLLELVSGFSAFPNKGVRVKPYFITRIEDKGGNVLEENKVESEEVVSPQTAYMMTYLLQGVVREGTATALADLGWPLAGKTGTTDKYTDAWFMGFSPTLCAGVWVGYDTKVTLGARQSGAVAALPIWKDFFVKVIESRKKDAAARGVELVPEDFEVPPNLSFVEIDRKTGLLATPICLFPLREVFFPGTEPSRYCTNQDHLRILDYYSQETAREEH
jgi:penicillin-binding protein 1A